MAWGVSSDMKITILTGNSGFYPSATKRFGAAYYFPFRNVRDFLNLEQPARRRGIESGTFLGLFGLCLNTTEIFLIVVQTPRFQKYLAIFACQIFFNIAQKEGKSLYWRNVWSSTISHSWKWTQITAQ